MNSINGRSGPQWKRVLGWIGAVVASSFIAACGGGGGGGGGSSGASAPPVGQPNITAQPQGRTVTVGGTATFSVVAENGTLRYQWRRNGTPIAGATAASYTTPATTINDNGARFTVAISNEATDALSPATPIVSNEAILVVNQSVSNTTPTLRILAGFVEGRGYVDGTNDAARFNSPGAIVRDPTSGDFLIADSSNHTIRRITAAGVVTTIAGAAGQTGTTDGAGTTARFNVPAGLAVIGTTLYVADAGNHSIRAIANFASSPVVSTLAGGTPGFADATGAAARFQTPQGIAVLGGNLYVTDYDNNRIRRVTTGGVVTTLAGSGAAGGINNANGLLATFSKPRGIVADAGGTVLYVSDETGHSIRQVTAPAGTAAGAVTTLAGLAGVSGTADGTGAAARFNAPAGMAAVSATNVLIADSANQLIRSLNPATGVVTTIAGTAGQDGTTDGTGTGARFSFPVGIATDGTNAYVVENSGHSVRRVVLATNVVTTLAGTPVRSGQSDGLNTGARFDNPAGAVADTSGNLYVADRTNDTIRRVDTTGTVSTIAGAPLVPGSADGLGSTARFNEPEGIALNAPGSTLYVADSLNHTIRAVTSGGSVTTLAGAAGVAALTNGTGAAARFNTPRAVTYSTVDGSIYVADTGNNAIRRVTTAGVVTTVAVPGQTLSGPRGIAVASNGDIYVADTGNNRIVLVPAGGGAATVVTTGLNGPRGIAYDAGTNRLYVANTGSHTVVRVALPGGATTTIVGTAGLPGTLQGTLPAGLTEPQSVSLPSASRLLISLPHGVMELSPLP
jgi:DNA-binding beta-propeller fold protein YncE